jgi:AraC-like DNA-binding protein
VQHSPRSWSHLNGAFSFGSMRRWQGRLDYRRRRHDLASGDTFLFDPGELFFAPSTAGADGAFRVIEIAPTTFEALCRAEGVRGAIHFGLTTTRAARGLAQALDALEGALAQGAEPLELQSRLAAVAHEAVANVLETSRRSPHLSPLRPCEKLRDLLHGSEAARLNLCDFARECGVSQFQLLRAFKRRYGAPPHAYGLHVRLERARQMLSRGFSVAQAAAANDFTDQSHLTRHFKRIWGMTPGRYAVGQSLTQVIE